MTNSVFPVGHYGGLRPGGTPGAADDHVVRVGWQQHRLSEDDFGVWILAHGLTETGKGVLAAEEITAKAAEAGLTDAKVRLDDLVAKGLLVLVGPADGADRTAEEFARKHRMDVLFVGLGNAPDRPDGHAVGVPGIGTAAVLDSGCYELWQWGSLAPTVWHSCEVRASVARELGEELSPVAALDQVLGDLRYLIVHGCAYLDVAASTLTD